MAPPPALRKACGFRDAVTKLWPFCAGRARRKLPPKPMCGLRFGSPKSLDDALDRTGLAFSPGSHTIPCKRGTYS